MTEIETIRKKLKVVADKQPPGARPILKTLSAQLRNFEKGDVEDKAVLRPEINKNIERLEKARAAGR